MNKEEACSATLKLITKYRKLLTWWTFVRETPRLMNSNMYIVFEYLTYFYIPYRSFMEHLATVEESLEDYINQCIGIQKDLVKLCKFVDRIMNTVVSYNSESRIYFPILYKIAMYYARNVFLQLHKCAEGLILFCEWRYKIFETFN
ncbi:hypothetical protein CEXT_584001 [Caerostris extrusa]|uniref:Uncharacterized protein n=1 Tax=Caerostris extrusa TaxID=172846 RepID=A0AAV4RVE6_CAEEX|nr:hypothetical protein CEXT_584001 [Caerostris extrusa]